MACLLVSGSVLESITLGAPIHSAGCPIASCPPANASVARTGIDGGNVKSSKRLRPGAPFMTQLYRATSGLHCRGPINPQPTTTPKIAPRHKISPAVTQAKAGKEQHAGLVLHISETLFRKDLPL
jgi:hypothetical protein